MFIVESTKPGTLEAFFPAAPPAPPPPGRPVWGITGTKKKRNNKKSNIKCYLIPGMELLNMYTVKNSC